MPSGGFAAPVGGSPLHSSELERAAIFPGVVTVNRLDQLDGVCFSNGAEELRIDGRDKLELATLTIWPSTSLKDLLL